MDQLEDLLGVEATARPQPPRTVTALAKDLEEAGTTLGEVGLVVVDLILELGRGKALVIAVEAVGLHRGHGRVHGGGQALVQGHLQKARGRWGAVAVGVPSGWR